MVTHRLLVLVILVACSVAGSSVAALAEDGRTFSVAPSGSDRAPGSADDPWATLGHALTQLGPGDTLVVRGGLYRERIRNPRLRPGTATAPVRVRAAPGERPVVQGLLWLKGADHWLVDGLNVTWDPAGSTSHEHMVKLTDGVGWRFENAEVWGARSFAGVLIAGTVPGEPADWMLRGNCIHGTAPSNGVNQDHLVYANTGLDAGTGTIERNLLFDAPNGMGVKLGGPAPDSGGTANVTVRNNTIVRTVQSVLVAWGSRNNVIERNLLHGVGDRYGNLRGYQLSGPGNVARLNAAGGASRLILNDEGYPGLTATGDNVFPVEPGFDEVSCRGLHPADVTSQRYGRHALAGPLERIGGVDRVQTAVDLSARVFPDGAATAFLARADAYPDALAAAPLAAALQAPVLLNPRDTLDARVATEIQRLGARHVHVLGGDAALGPAVVGALRAGGLEVNRIGGADRFETARQLAAALSGGRAQHAYVVEGSNADPARGWPDALAVAPLAAHTASPVLLTGAADLPAATRTALAELAVDEITVIGGEVAVSERVIDQLVATGAAVQRVWGASRYDTSAVLVRHMERAGLSGARPWVASGRDWPDALVAGPAVARDGGILLLVDGVAEELPRPVRDWLAANQQPVERIRILGGERAVRFQLEAQLDTGG